MISLDHSESTDAGINNMIFRRIIRIVAEVRERNSTYRVHRECSVVSAPQLAEVPSTVPLEDVRGSCRARRSVFATDRRI